MHDSLLDIKYRKLVLANRHQIVLVYLCVLHNKVFKLLLINTENLFDYFKIVTCADNIRNFFSIKVLVRKNYPTSIEIQFNKWLDKVYVFFCLNIKRFRQRDRIFSSWSYCQTNYRIVIVFLPHDKHVFYISLIFVVVKLLIKLSVLVTVNNQLIRVCKNVTVDYVWIL